jgi:hypothetical protein
MQTNSPSTPTLYWVIVVFFLLWNTVGVLSFGMHVTLSDEALAAMPEDQRDLYESFPLWVTGLFGLAVVTGMGAAIGLAMRKAWSVLSALISLIAVVIQMSYNVFATNSIEVYGFIEAISMPVLVVLFATIMYFYARKAADIGRLS